MESQRRWNTVKIYLDSYIAANFWMHLLCMYLVGTMIKLRNGKTKRGRIAAAAFCCAVPDAVYLFFAGAETEKASLLFFGAAVLELVMGAWIAYGRKRIVRNTLLLFGVTVLLAGFFQIVPIKNIGLFCFLGTVLLPFLIAGLSSAFREKQTQKLLYEVRLCQNEEEQWLTAFLDTGNRLRLYGCHIPVVLVDEDYLKEWIKTAERMMPQKLVFLPYKGVGGKGILHGVRLHCVIPVEKEGTVAGEVAAVAAEHRLFQGCTYQMILQPEVLTMVCVRDTQEGERDVI
ncbi:MAG: sigma-E processing peptidase SpoIIGA [Lachnospiraceae bacterium]|nr:sigma-E processing peptidase SpoIIGA [Lachnospiraceae bacterium]